MRPAGRGFGPIPATWGFTADAYTEAAEELDAAAAAAIAAYIPRASARPGRPV